MKAKELLKKLQKLSKKELEQEVIYRSDEYSLTGVIQKAGKSRATYYTTGEDDPAPIYTKRQLIEDEGYERSEIGELDVEIPKGAFVIEI